MKQLAPILALTICTPATAGIVPTSDTFDTGISNNGTWTSVGAVATTIEFDSVSSFDGGAAFGDGLANDGGLRFNTVDGIQGNEAIGLNIAGTMEEGEEITFTGTLYNDNASFFRVFAQLWNATDNVLLGASAEVVIDGTGNSPDPEDFSVIYTAVASDAGDVLQIRFIENTNNAVRDPYVDNYSVVPEPGAMTLLALGGLAVFRRNRK